MADGSKSRLPTQGFVLEPQNASKAGGEGYESSMFPDLVVVHQFECSLFWANFGQHKEHLPANFEDFARFKDVHIIVAEEWETSVIEDRWPLENFFHKFTEEGNNWFSNTKVALHVPQTSHKERIKTFSMNFKPLEKLKGKVTIVATDLAWGACLWPSPRKDWELSINGKERFREREVLRGYEIWR